MSLFVITQNKSYNFLIKVFVELHELENEEMQWREKARWIKFEENVEEATGKWGKPHVANLSFLQIIELRKYLESGEYTVIVVL